MAKTNHWLEAHISQMNGQDYFRYDTEDSDSKEQWSRFCDVSDELRELGYEFEDPYIEHDCISGYLKRLEATRP
jgi:hypothetical protein